MKCNSDFSVKILNEKQQNLYGYAEVEDKSIILYSKGTQISRKTKRSLFGVIPAIIFDSGVEGTKYAEIPAEEVATYKTITAYSAYKGTVIMNMKNGDCIGMTLSDDMWIAVPALLDVCGAKCENKAHIPATKLYAPSTPPPPIASKKFVCTECKQFSTGWYSTCPNCGATGKMVKTSF